MLINTASEKATVAHHHVAHLARCDYGLGFAAARLVYRATVEAIVTYALSVFGHRATLVKPREQLWHAQRTTLMAITREYRMTSTEALCVLAGVLPIDYLLWERVAVCGLNLLGTPWGTTSN